jgi:translation initiation factor IF-3
VTPSNEELPILQMLFQKQITISIENISLPGTRNMDYCHLEYLKLRRKKESKKKQQIRKGNRK